MTEWALKRFWTTAEVAPTEAGFAIALDGRRVKTPAKRDLTVPTQALARAIAAEWQAQEERVDPLSMPFTRTANSALDKVAVQHREVADLLASYGDTDLLCYRADSPAELVRRQAEAWDPLLDWAERTLAARLETRKGIMPVAQDARALARLSESVHALDAFRLAAFHDLVSLTGSLVLGFAAAHRLHEPETLWATSRIDEAWQAERWGADEEATAVAERKAGEFLQAVRFYRLSADDGI
jgi:chaperone required for assembly of F1-ATPase